MEKIVINTPGFRSEILVGESWENVNTLIPENGVVIITDDNVLKLYGGRFPKVPVLSINPGEESKKLEVIEQLSEKLQDAAVDRSGFILAIGGGVVCDLAGFLASIYLRGIRCGYVSSSLLAQVDASTGGKNGVNLGGTKNVLGVIRQPEFVICDPAMLLTLSDEEYLSGLSEMIKTAIIGDSELFESIEYNHNEIMNRDQSVLSSLVAKSVSFKAGIVTEDEKETGLRRILNFGHTYGHAIEMYTSVKHGFAVASGMELATWFSFEKGFIRTCEKDRILNLLNKFGLLQKRSVPADYIEKLIMHDKKKTGTDINFVFTEGIGKAKVQKIALADVISFYKKSQN